MPEDDYLRAKSAINVDSPARRSVRSFVVRAGRATAGQQRALTELWPLYGVEFTNAPLDLDRLFGRKAPRMIEIGFGAGEALLAFARSNPGVDCIGIEVHRPGVGHLLLGAHEAGLKNLRIVCHDAVDVLQQLPASSVSLAHIFFADPWPKKRHHKRRLIQSPFIESLARVMEPQGLLRLATDWEPYAQHMRLVMDASSAFTSLGDESGFAARPDVRPLTRFERRGQRLGHQVWDLAYVRVTGA